MAVICHLISQIDSVPNQVLKIGNRLVIGRNKDCCIRDIKCSRSHCSVTFDGQSLSVHFSKTDEIKNLLNGQLLTGPGFQYKLVFVHQNDGTNDLEMNESIRRQSDQTLDDNLFSLEDSVKSIVSKPENNYSNSWETVWESLHSGRVHICRFKGGGQSSSSIAAFDFDGTLIGTKSGNNFATDKNDWRLFDKSLTKRLSKLIADDFRIVVISNQLPISQGRYKLEDIKYRFEAALTAIGVPCLVMIAAYDDIYRKPRPGLWRLLAQQFNDQPIDLTTSFYVGDAAGRKKQLNGKSDHSSADLLFAANSNIPFLTPERFLNDLKPRTWNSNKTCYSDLTITTFRPQERDSSYMATKLDANHHLKDINEVLANYLDKPHIIVMCGLSACGKTSFYLNHLKQFNYSHISRDDLKTIEKCHKVCENYLKNKQNCVIDNTNVDTSARKIWIDLCHKQDAIPILFHFDISVEQALHNNKFRRIVGVNSPVTDLVIRSQNKHFIKPTVSEGFESIFKINFVPKFTEKEHQMIYFMYLSER